MNPIWEKRIRRTRTLEAHPAFDAEMMRFVRSVLSYQRDIYHQAAASGREETPRLETGFLASFLPPFLELVESHGPPRLSRWAQHFRDRDQDEWERLLRAYWNRTTAPTEGALPFFSKAMLQPYTMFRAQRWRVEMGVVESDGSTCPFCERPPIVILQTPHRGRSFVCSLCSTEWPCAPGLCMGCSEEQPGARHCHRSAGVPWIWSEACASCQHFIKVIDLGQEPEGDPIVDEIGSGFLDAMARADQYTKVEPNLVGA